jgi:hypothetical protein
MCCAIHTDCGSARVQGVCRCRVFAVSCQRVLFALQLAINHLVPDIQQSNVSPEIAEWSHLVGLLHCPRTQCAKLFGSVSTTVAMVTASTTSKLLLLLLLSC